MGREGGLQWEHWCHGYEDGFKQNRITGGGGVGGVLEQFFRFHLGGAKTTLLEQELFISKIGVKML